MAGGYVFQCLALFAIFYVFRHYPQANTLSFLGIYFLCLAIIAAFIVKLMPQTNKSEHKYPCSQ